MAKNQYVCTELAPYQSGYVACKTWSPIESNNLIDTLAITPSQMVLIGGSIIGTMGIILAFVIIAKASKML